MSYNLYLFFSPSCPRQIEFDRFCPFPKLRYKFSFRIKLDSATSLAVKFKVFEYLFKGEHVFIRILVDINSTRKLFERKKE